MNNPPKPPPPPSPQNNPVVKELQGLRSELQHLQDKGLASVWDQAKKINEQNAELLAEIKALRKTLSREIAVGVVGGVILGFLLVDFLEKILFFW